MGLSIDQKEFETLFPFFLEVNEAGKIIAFGKSAAKCFFNLAIGSDAFDVFTIERPADADFRSLDKLVKKIVTIKSSTTKLSFTGEILKLSSGGHFIFAVSPVIENMETLTSLGLSYSDFATHSPLFDSFVLIQFERFASKEKMQAFEALQNYNTYARLNLDIANFCSSCFEISKAINYSMSSLENRLGWKGSYEKVSDSQPVFSTEILTNGRYVTLPLIVSEKPRFFISFERQEEGDLPEYLKIFLSSMRFTLENLVTRIDQQNAIEEAQANELSASKMSALGEMAAGIAHELNNPLTVVKGNADLILFKLKQEQVPNIALIEKIDKIVKMTERSARIIHGLKVFAREASEDPKEKMNLSEIIQDTLEFCKARISHKKIKLECSTPANCFSFGRATQISQVILNLINNAYDAVENSKDPWIKITIEPSGNFWQISVQDSGSGIPQNISEKIMSPFFTTKGPGKGTGLGLSICNSIIKQHDGSLWYDAQASNTCFRFNLPVFVEEKISLQV